jgi:hypothetical protein
VDDRHQPRLRVALQLLQQPLVGDRLAPVGLDLDDVGAVAAGDLGDPPPEVAAAGDDRGLPGLQQVGDPGLHPGGPGRLQRDQQALPGAKDPPQKLDHLQEDLVEVRVQVAEHRLLHRLEHRELDVGRPRAAQQPPGRLQRGKTVLSGHRHISLLLVEGALGDLEGWRKEDLSSTKNFAQQIKKALILGGRRGV